MSNWYFEKQELRLTPSVLDGFDAAKEYEYRKEGARFIMQLGSQLGLGYVTIATGVVYFHRFYLFHSFKIISKHLAACCCLFLSGKAEETPKRAKDIIRTAKDILTDLEFQELGEDPKEAMMQLEKLLLKAIRFDFHVNHPYRYLLKYAKSLKGRKEELEKMVQMAWTFVNDSFCTTICLQWQPEIVAIAFIHLASKIVKFEIIDWVNRKENQFYWWEIHVEGVTTKLIEDICHELLDVYCSEQSSKKTLEEAGKAIINSNCRLEDKTVSCVESAFEHKNGYSTTETFSSNRELENKRVSGTTDSVLKFNILSNKKTISSECANILDKSTIPTATLAINDDVWNALKKIQVTDIISDERPSNIVFQQNIHSASYYYNIPSMNMKENNFEFGQSDDAITTNFPFSHNSDSMVKPNSDRVLFEPKFEHSILTQKFDLKLNELSIPQIQSKPHVDTYINSLQYQNNFKKENYNENIPYGSSSPTYSYTDCKTMDSFSFTRNSNFILHDISVDCNNGSTFPNNSSLQLAVSDPQEYYAQAVPVSGLPPSSCPTENLNSSCCTAFSNEGYSLRKEVSDRNFNPPSTSAEPLYSPIGPSYSSEEPHHVAEKPYFTEDPAYLEEQPSYVEEPRSYSDGPSYSPAQPSYFPKRPYLLESPKYSSNGPAYSLIGPTFSATPSVSAPVFIASKRYSSQFSDPLTDPKSFNSKGNFSRARPYIYR